jgi:hypothetical protein
VGDDLSRLLQDEIDKGQIKDLKVCRRSPGISHLLFADGNLLFFEASADQANKATSQRLSPGK